MNKSIDDLLLYPFVKSGFFLFAADVCFIKMALGKFYHDQTTRLT